MKRVRSEELGVRSLATDSTDNTDKNLASNCIDKTDKATNKILASFPDELVGQDMKKTYDTTCPECGKELWVAPSIFMKMGINRGGALCPVCRVRLYLKIDNNNERMIATTTFEE